MEEGKGRDGPGRKGSKRGLSGWAWLDRSQQEHGPAETPLEVWEALEGGSWRPGEGRGLKQPWLPGKGRGGGE